MRFIKELDTLNQEKNLAKNIPVKIKHVASYNIFQRRTNSCEKSKERVEGGNWGAAAQYMYDS